MDEQTKAKLLAHVEKMMENPEFLAALDASDDDTTGMTAEEFLERYLSD